MDRLKHNLVYRSNQLVDFYSEHRRCWGDLYPSEKFIIKQAAGPEGRLGRVLDVGCATGGLGDALRERFDLSFYDGVDINAQCIDEAKRRQRERGAQNLAFTCGDILNCDLGRDDGYDNVFSLSCADWNVATAEIIERCWRSVSPGGHLIITLRLTPGQSLKSPTDSYQYIYFGPRLPGNRKDLEKAPYVVLNIRDALGLFLELSPRPASLAAYGYWGTPSPSAVTKYGRLVFTALLARKAPAAEQTSDMSFVSELPADLFI